MSEQPLWTEAELSDQINVPRATLKRWRYEGVGPPFLRLGRHVRYDPAAIRRWLREQGREPRSS